MPPDGRQLHNRQHGQLVKRNLDVALVQLLQQLGNVKSAGTFRSGIAIGLRFENCAIMESFETIMFRLTEAGSGKTAGA